MPLAGCLRSSPVELQLNVIMICIYLQTKKMPFLNQPLGDRFGSIGLIVFHKGFLWAAQCPSHSHAQNHTHACYSMWFQSKTLMNMTKISWWWWWWRLMTDDWWLVTGDWWLVTDDDVSSQNWEAHFPHRRWWAFSGTTTGGSGSRFVPWSNDLSHLGQVK